MLNLSMANRVLVAPPGTPEPIMTALRDAFDQAVADPDYQQQLADANIPSSPMNWGDLEELREGAHESMLVYEELLKSLN